MNYKFQHLIMKKLLFIALLISSAAFSQSVTKKETITKLLLKSWKADYGMMNGLRIEKNLAFFYTNSFFIL